ncbi:hypothetical protein T08_6131, partial [Trichinella sp. T8]
MVEASHVRHAATPSLKQHRYLAEEFILAAPVILYAKGEKSSADVMKGGAYKVRTKYPYRSEGQSRLTKKQPVIKTTKTATLTQATSVQAQGNKRTCNQSDKGLIYCTEFVGDKVTGEARVAYFAGLRRRFSSAVTLLQMPTATEVASILIHLVWNCTAAILSSLCIFPKGVQYQPAPNG